MRKIILSLFLVLKLALAIDVNILSSTQMLTILGNTNGDNTIFAVSNAGDINGDSKDDFIIGGSGNNYESAYLIYGSSTFPSVNIDWTNYVLDPSTVGIKITGNAKWDGFGSVLSDIGDINGDGKNDFMIGAPRKEGYNGAVYVIYGGTTLSNIDLHTDLDPSTTGFTIKGDTYGDYLGCSISKAGNINNDGHVDIVVGIYGKNNKKGAAFVIYGGPSRSDITVTDAGVIITPATAGFSILGEAQGDYFGWSVSNAGDVNGDGRDDIIIGAPYKNSDRGAAYVIYGKPSPTLTKIDLSNQALQPATTGFRILGNAAGDYFGYSVSAAGDVNGDDIDDIIIGAYGKDSEKGAVYIIYGSTNPKNIDLSDPTQALDPATTGFMVKGIAGSQLGYSVKGVGDLNDDDHDEVMIGAPGQSAVHVILGGDPTTLKDIDLSIGDLDPAKNGFTITGNPNSQFGLSVSSGDFNGDGKTELFVATSGEGATTEIGAGYIFDISKCADNCAICSIPSTCEECLTNYELVTSTLQCRKCTVGEYYSNLKCEKCIGHCDVCDNSLTCQTCSAGFGRWDLDKECLECPQTGKFFSNDGECQDCLSNCDTCSVLATCEVCSDGHGRRSSDTQCVECPQTGMYLSSAGECKDCIQNCDICSESDSTICQVCLDGYGRRNSDTECITCPQTGKYLSNNKECINCLPNCDKCSDSTTCQICSDGYGRRNSDTECMVCPQTGMYLSNDGECLDCISNCDTCSNSESCDICSTGYGRLDSKCVTCPQNGMYFSNGDCLACSEGCLHCQDSSLCLACTDNFMLSDWHTCVEKTENSDTDTSASVFEGTSLIGASLSSGSSLPLNFGLVAKILRNVKYLNISVSPDLLQTFFSWKVASGALSAPKSWSSKSESEPLPLVFERYGLQPVFIINYFKPLLMTLIGLFFFVIFKPIEIYFSKKNPKGRLSSISRSINIAASNFALTQFYSNLDDVILYLVIDARSSKFDTSFRVFSFILGLVLLVAGMALLGGHIWFLYKYQSFKNKKSSLEAFKLKYENIDLIFKDFKDLNLSTQSFLLAHLIRCLLSSLSFALLFEYPLFQILSLLALNLGVIAFLFMKQSFKEMLNLCGQIFCEFILLLANICMLIMCVFGQVDSEPLKAIEKLSKCVIALNLALLIGCAVFLLITIGKMLYKMYLEKKKEKSKSFEVNSSLNSKLDSLKLNHPNRTYHSDLTHDISTFDLNNDSQIGIMNKSTLNGNGIKNEKKVFQGTPSWMLHENQGEDLVNISNSNLDFSGFVLAAAPPQRLLYPKRAGRIKMPEGTTLPGYIDYQKRENELLEKTEPQSENSSHEIESYKGVSLRNLQTRSKRRRVNYQKEDDVVVERMRE